MNQNLATSMIFLGLVTAFLSAAGCKESAPNPPEGKVKWIDPNTLQAGPIVHESLPDDLLVRIKHVHATFADVDGMSEEKWIDDFKRDLDPEGNVRIWEDMAVAYNKYLERRKVDLETKKEVFKVVLMRSMASEEDVLAKLELTKLSTDDAKTIMAGYPAAPQPVEVISSP